MLVASIAMQKTELKTFTIDDIRSWGPCYEPAKKLPEGWSGTALDLLAKDNISVEDKFWVVLREDLIDAKTLRLFAVWCARQALMLVENPDPRSLAAVDVAERYANSEATIDELRAARDAAWDVARDAARAAARAAARDAARDAAWDVARDAAWDAAWDVARDAARAAARAAARDAQLQHLIEMLTPVVVAGPCVPISRLEVAALVGSYALEYERRQLPFDYVGELFVLSDGRKIYRELRGRRYGYTVSVLVPVVVA